ncbi:signal peptidase II [Candidatus Latescibacterota bacterium]
MKNKLLLTFLFLFAIVSDQISKYLISQNFEMYESKSLIGNLLNIHYIKNPGAAFGLTLGHPLLMLVITILIIITLGYLFIRGNIFSDSMLGKFAMVMVLGGAFGNLIDRIRFREVVDFIDMGIGTHRWPVYNMADVYVTIGMFILIFYFTFKETPGQNTPANASE